jgi:hypothetical protein
LISYHDRFLSNVSGSLAASLRKPAPFLQLGIEGLSDDPSDDHNEEGEEIQVQSDFTLTG